MWIIDGNRLFSNDDLRNLILSLDPHSGIFFLDGPTRSGKTEFLKCLPKEKTIVTGFHTLYEYFTGSLQQGTDAYAECKKQLIYIYSNMGDILCFEDIDICLAGKPSSQGEFARIIKKMAQTKIVIMTGYKMEKRCRTFLESLRPFHYCRVNTNESNKAMRATNKKRWE